MFGFEHYELQWMDYLDIAIVSALLYMGIQHLRGSRALAVATGLALLCALYFLAQRLGLYTLSWFLEYAFSSLFIFIVIVFQQDIRHALGEIGSSNIFSRKVSHPELEEILSACESMAKARIGALIVIERGIRLDDIISREGVRVDAKISSRLLCNIFYPKAPLHDGAVIISRGRIAAAACILPLASTKDQSFGTRHRAALGTSEETDAVVLVVSEERGQISLARSGFLARNLTIPQLRQALNGIL